MLYINNAHNVVTSQISCENNTNYVWRLYMYTCMQMEPIQTINKTA